jgi:hypothetical protein
VSFGSLDANEYGLELDTINMKLNEARVYTSGVYLLGVSHKFIKYPRTQQTIKYATTRGDDGEPVACRTNDGLPVSISFSFNYRLKSTADELSRLFLVYGEEDKVKQLYGRISRNVIRSVAAEWSTFQYFTSDKTAIQEAMRISLAADVGQEGAVVESFQLLDVTIPATFQEARTRQETANQQISQALNDLSVARINAQSAVQVATQQASLIVSKAQNTAEQMRLSTAAEIQSLAARYEAERASYLNMRASLGLSVREMLTMVWLDAQADAFAQATAAGGVSGAAVVQAAAPQAVGGF